jgi:catechol-2,3-dioxygenase
MTQIDHRLGKFAISLAVKSLEASRAFYQKLGFEPVAGDGKSWQVLKNGDVTMGLVQGISQRNKRSSFVDVREIHARAKAAGLVPTAEVGLDGTGPGSFTLTDPDGNPVLFDQHV